MRYNVGQIPMRVPPTQTIDHSTLQKIWTDSLTGLLGNTQASGFKNFPEAVRMIRVHFGSQCAPGILHQLGQSAFRHTLRLAGQQIGIDSNAYRLLPQSTRFSEGLRILSSALDLTSSMGASLTDLPEVCTLTLTGKLDGVCPFVLGFLQEYACWAGNGRNYPVREDHSPETCCSFELSKNPLD